MEAQYQIDRSNPSTGIDLSEQNVLSCTSGPYYPNSCSGNYLSNPLDFLRDSGTPDEACNPYTGNDPAHGGSCGTSRCSDYLSRTYKITGWTHISTDAATIKSYLYTHGPVMVWMPVFSDFPWYDASFWQAYYYSHGTSGSYDGHFVVIVGWDDQGPGTGDDYWIVRNSWGTSGGDVNSGYGGYFYMTQDPTTGFFGIYQEAAIISAVSTPTGYTVTFNTDPTSGTITADGVTKTNGATGTYGSGARVHVVANPPSGYSFSYWETSGVSVDSTSSADTYMTVSNNGWLKAFFSSSSVVTRTVRVYSLPLSYLGQDPESLKSSDLDASIRVNYFYNGQSQSVTSNTFFDVTADVGSTITFTVVSTPSGYTFANKWDHYGFSQHDGATLSIQVVSGSGVDKVAAFYA
jgi:hypothetical protein